MDKQQVLRHYFGHDGFRPGQEKMVDALLSGRDYVLPDDIRRMALPVLSHRLILTPEARMKGVSAQQVLSQLIDTVPVPTGRA